MGRWQEKNTVWFDQSMTYCTCCGQLIPKNYWEAQVEGEPLIFCKPDCERLYREYLLPTRRESGGPLVAK